jgi:hypothetical protein
LLVACSAVDARAQETVNYASVSGRVADATGGVIRGARVSIRQTETNLTATAVTDKDGRFRFPYLRVGPYELVVSQAGFGTSKQSLTLTVGAAFELPIALNAAAVSTSVTVTAETAVLEGARSQIAGTVSRDEVKNVPLNGRAFLDLRRYNRLSPTTWINGRLVLGGWMNGDELPLERRFSVGGVGTIPGFDFRKYQPGIVDVSQCSDAGAPPSGNPAQCERVALAQLEYRNELHSSLLDFLNSRPIRLRGVGFTVQPTIVAFVDAGRGWLVGKPSGTLE